MRKRYFCLALLIILLLPYCSSSQNKLAKEALALEKGNPYGFYDAASNEFKNGNKNGAAFLFYLGQLRTRYYLQSTHAKAEEMETFNVVQGIIGMQINGYLGGNTAQWLRTIDSVLAWDKRHDFEFYPKKKDEQSYQEVLNGLVELQNELATIQSTGKKLSDFAYEPGFDFKLFRQTPLKRFSDAVEYENVQVIDEALKDPGINIDYPESKFGNTLLMLAVANNRKQAALELLKHGANPNKMDKNGDLNALIIACDHIYSPKCDPAILKMLLKYGGNVNTEEKIKRDSGEGMHGWIEETLLMIACESECLDKVKTLVAAGADINKYTYYEGYGAITNAIIQERLANVRYLVIDKKAKIPHYCYRTGIDDSSAKGSTLTDMLKEKDYSNDPENEKIKKELLTYLKAKGLQ